MKRNKELEAEIRDGLSSNLVWVIECYESVDSTMDCARELVSRISPGQVGLILAQSQARGRGRQGRRWESPEAGFFGTFVFPTIAALERLPSFTLVVGLELARILEKRVDGLKLKWPNDVLTRSGKKIAGILVEHLLQMNRSWLLVGIGVNLKGAPGNLTSASSVDLEGGANLGVAELSRALCSTLPQALGKFERTGFETYREEWLARSFQQGESITVHTGNGVISGLYRGVTPGGALLVLSGNKIQEILSGEINVTCN